MSTEEYISLVKRKESPWWVSTVCRGIGGEYFKSALKWDIGINNYRYLNETHEISISDATQLQKIISSQDDNDFYNTYLELCRSACQALDGVAHEARAIDLSNAGLQSNRDQLVKFIHISLKAVPFLPTLVLIQSKFEGDLRRMLGEELREEPQADAVNEAIETCVVAEEENNVVDEARDILEIASLLNQEARDWELQDVSVGTLMQRCPNTYQRSIEHIERFGWLKTFTYLGEPFDMEEIVKRVVHAASTNDASVKLRGAKMRMEEALNKAEITVNSYEDERLKQNLRMARKYLFWRFERVDVHFKAEAAMRDIESILAAHANIPRDLMPWATSQEIEAWLSQAKSLPVEEMHKRRTNGFDYLVEDGEHSIIALATKRPVVDQVRTEDVSGATIKGSAACIGVARGPVRIVSSVLDIDKVENGDILVTPMTTPDLMLAIERSAAIVTDEGGVLCHAAIISRELNIPCIIGTNNSTSSLRDGDIVEVRAQVTGSKLTIITPVEHSMV